VVVILKLSKIEHYGDYAGKELNLRVETPEWL
jgi:hypothetical protein